MIHQLTARLDRAPKGLLTLAALALVFLIGIVDFLTGLELHLVFFYIFPISLTSCFSERRSAILIDKLFSQMYGWHAAIIDIRDRVELSRAYRALKLDCVQLS